MLVHFKLSDADIKRAILSMDEKVMTLDRVKQLITFAPTAEEVINCTKHYNDSFLGRNAQEIQRKQERTWKSRTILS
jgi:hypothetical protein